jgi:hypothetical protein
MADRKRAFEGRPTVTCESELDVCDLPVDFRVSEVYRWNGPIKETLLCTRHAVEMVANILEDGTLYVTVKNLTSTANLR